MSEVKSKIAEDSDAGMEQQHLWEETKRKKKTKEKGKKEVSSERGSWAIIERGKKKGEIYISEEKKEKGDARDTIHSDDNKLRGG